MENNSIKKNIIYSAILTTSNYVIQLVTFPYLSRILGVENIGILNFVDGVVNYFIMISMLGLNILGIREVAKASNDISKRNSIFSVLFSINLCFTIIVTLIYISLIYLVPQFYEKRDLLLLGIFKLLFNLFLIEWFYKGIENFKYITARTLVLRIIYLFSLFIFVKNRNDIYVYYIITVLLVVFNAVVNWIYSQRFVLYSWAHVRTFKLYIKPYIYLGFYLILTSAYTTFNVIYLGFVSSEREVGYYVTALKIYIIILGLFTSLTNVMMPRMSALLSNGSVIEFRKKINATYWLFFSVSIPLVFAIIPLSDAIIAIIAGNGYEGAVLPMQLIVPLILIVGIAQVFVSQILIPLKRDAVILKIAVVGAVVGLSFNLTLVSNLASVGTAITLLCSELSVTIFLFCYMFRHRLLFIPINSIKLNVFYSIPYWIIVVLLKGILTDNWQILLLSFVLCCMYFLLSQLFFIKNPWIVSFVQNYIKYKNSK